MFQHHEQQVRERAYYIWEGEGRVFGRADAHWFQAEAELAAGSAEAVLTVAPVAEASVPAPAKALKAAVTRAKAKAEKAPAKAAKKVDAPAAVAKARRAPRGESPSALH